MSKRKKAKLWSHSCGDHGTRVRVYERKPGGPIQMSVPSGDGTYRRESLGHTDRRRAELQAAVEAERLAAGHSGRVTVGVLIGLYLERKSPAKKPSGQRADRRRAKLWLRRLGPDTDPHEIPTEAWRAFVRDRRSGAIDARGRPVPPEARQPVRDRAVGADCKWLLAVLNWGTKEHTGSGYLLRENVLRGMEVPVEKNPRRPVASRDRYEAIRAVTDDVTMRVSRDGRTERSWLSEIFDLAMSTGRRLSHVLQLRGDDLLLDRGPHGFIRWRGDAEGSKGTESIVPIDAEARAAIDRQLARRPVVGAAYLFSAPTNDAKPVSRYVADRWLRKAEKIAGVEPQEGSLWHAYRRGWATARKAYPDVDVAKLGGWKNTDTLRAVYQQADEGTMLEIVTARPELREIRTQSHTR